MHCPKCGTKALAGHKFCCECGLSLQRFAQLLAESLSDVGDENVTRDRLGPRELEEKRNLVEQLLILGIVFATDGMGIVVMMVNGNIGAGMFLFTLAVVIASLNAYYHGLWRKRISAQYSFQTTPSAETPDKLLLEHQAQIPISVMEQTTAQLGKKIESHRYEQ